MKKHYAQAAAFALLGVTASFLSVSNASAWTLKEAAAPYSGTTISVGAHPAVRERDRHQGAHGSGPLREHP